MKAGLRRGQLTKWKDERGFGFIRPVDDGKEIFLHISALEGLTRRPKVGDIIYYRTTVEDGKIRACNAFILGARKTQALNSSKERSRPHLSSLFPVFSLLLLTILPLAGSAHFAWKTDNILPLVLYPMMSVLTFALYAHDKERAQKGGWRTPEQTLHLCELAGGWPGGFIAQKKLRHKNRKQSYQLIFWGIVIIHYVLWLVWFVFGEELFS
ncbi:DUF1294 domain-containing protein [filamentous cyanobacterium CCP5]|nr:DUF1294 domain-containing protein [filamentous cyanobacterium CCP5]